METIFTILFFLFAIRASYWFGKHSMKIFSYNPYGKEEDELPLKKTHPKEYKVYQFFFNFLGSFVGWIALWLIIPKPVCDIFEVIAVSKIEFSAVHTLLFLLFFVGITGHLPKTIMGVILSVSEIFKKIIEKV